MMKEEILKRAMFAMPLSKKAQSSGIMAGFDMEEMEGEEEDLKEMPPMARTPQNPEILMNSFSSCGFKFSFKSLDPNTHQMDILQKHPTTILHACVHRLLGDRLLALTH
jgi:hypothetical protein